MAPIFTSPDIAAIVAAFPPPLPSNGHATLLQSASGERLLQSSKVLARLEKILASNSERLEVLQLSSLLDVKDATRLLNATDNTSFFYNRDRSRLLSRIEQQRIQDELESATRSTFIDLDAWSEQRDIERRILDHSIGDLVKVVKLHITGDGKRFAYQQSHLASAQELLRVTVEKTRPEKCNVSAALPDTASKLHKWIAETTLSSAPELNASAQVEENHVVVTPEEYEEHNMTIRAFQAEIELREQLKEREAVELAKAAEIERFTEILLDKIYMPFELYRSSVPFIRREPISSPLDLREPMMLAVDQEHFRPAIQLMQQSNLLRNTSLNGDWKFFSALSLTTRPPDAAEVHRVTASLLKKYHIKVDATRLRAKKFQILDNKVQQLSMVNDPSWVMQNVIWILLSQVAQLRGKDLCFASAGKDTTRMLRLYQKLVEMTDDDEKVKQDGRRNAKMVEDFKKKVVANSIRREDLVDMRMLAQSTVNESKRWAYAQATEATAGDQVQPHAPLREPGAVLAEQQSKGTETDPIGVYDSEATEDAPLDQVQSAVPLRASSTQAQSPG